jgi:hypothetical protein
MTVNVIGQAAGGSYASPIYNLDSHINMGIGSAAPAFAGGALGAGAALAIGPNTLSVFSNGDANIAIGNGALNNMVDGDQNIAIGINALGFVQHADAAGNVAIGYNALNMLGFSVAGENPGNTAVGNRAGASLTSGTYNTAFGYNAGASLTPTVNYTTSLGNSTNANANGAVAIGCDHTGTAASTTTQDVIALGTANHQVQINNSTTGAGSAALGSNCPATTATAPYTWLKLMSSDGSTVYVPAWK